MEKNCLHCNSSFYVRKDRFEKAKYCSRNCHNKARETHEIRICVICSKSFKYYSCARGGIGKYCSQQCSGKGRRLPRTKKNCLVCEKEFTPKITFKQKKYCSQKCYADTMRGISKKCVWDQLTKQEALERLKRNYEKFVIRKDRECWSWSGSLAKIYPSVRYNKKSIGAHRASWLLHKGEDPGKLFVLHTCDNPPCTRPDHLFLGTARDNVIDMHQKGRAVILKGEKAHGARLKKIDVIKIKKLIQQGKKLTTIAVIFNISLSTIYDIKDERTWKHVKIVKNKKIQKPTDAIVIE